MMHQSDAQAHERRQQRFAEELAVLLDSGRGTESINLFCRGGALGLYPDDETLKSWLYGSIGEPATKRLVKLFAQSTCAFCRRGLEACAECDRHGHFDYREICESCLGLGACRCDFCYGSGLSSIEAVPKGLRVPVAIRRSGSALRTIVEMSNLLTGEPAKTNPRDLLKEQTALILRLNGLLGILENEFDDHRELHWWTTPASIPVLEIVTTWPHVCQAAEERICAAFQSMSTTATRMAAEAVEGSDYKSLALARAKYFQQFSTPETLDRTDIDHPVLDRLREKFG